MAIDGVKISDLEEAKTLFDECCFPIVQFNTTKKVLFKTIVKELDKHFMSSILIGDTETIAPGLNAEVINIGTSNNPVLNFRIPKGAKGDKGEKGEPGQKGEPGTAGVTDYNDLTNKPVIPTKTSELTNDSDFTTKAYVDNLVGAIASTLDNINGEVV